MDSSSSVPGPYGEPLIATSALRLRDIPGVDAGWPEIQRFCLSFDGYSEAGSFEKCFEVASAVERSIQGATTDGLRIAAFAIQRQIRNDGEPEPDEDALARLRALLGELHARLSR